MSLFQISVLKKYVKQQDNEATVILTQTDREIDAMVYEFYRLTEEEIQIDEQSN